MVRLLRGFLGPFKWLVVVVVVLTFFRTMANLYLPDLMAKIVDTGIVNHNIRYILQMGAVMLAVAAASGVSTVFASYYSSIVAARVGRDVRSKIFSKVESFSLYEFNNIGTASLITRTTNDINQIQMVLVMMMRISLFAPIMAVGGVIMAVSTDARLSVVFVFVVPVIAGFVLLVFRRSVPMFRTMQKEIDKLNRVLREGLAGIRVVRAFNRVARERERFTTVNTDLTKIAIDVNVMMASLWPGLQLLMNVATIVIVWFGALRVNYGDLQVGDLMAFIQYGMQIMFSLFAISMTFIMIPRSEASAVRINQVLEVVPDIRDAEEVKRAGSKRGFVEFRNVTFRYPGAEEPVLRDISFAAAPGEVTAVIGGTGAGKSTMVNLIPRLYDVQSGSILVDGVDVREMAQENLRARLGFVPQKAVLFSGSVAENIRYGKDDASDDEVKSAADTAQATEFIDHMQDRFDSYVAQGGANLSGGQKQRLSIARALVRRPEVYIFDDTFSALDFKTDARLRAALRRQTADATVLIVAQRMATVMDADRIIVMDEGRIVGTGRHRELLATCQVYREIVASQLSEEEIA